MRANPIPSHPLQGSWRIIPYLFTEARKAPARQMLVDAAALADTDLARERVQFLRDAFRLFEIRAEILRLAYPDTQRASDNLPQDYNAALAAWIVLRDEMIARYGHVISGGPIPDRLGDLIND
jgi:hypothetical protein